MTAGQSWWDREPSRCANEERRASPRYPGGVRALCRPLGSAADTWPARVRDVSTLGVGLLLPRPLGMGALLQIEFEGTTIDIHRTVLARVIHVQKDEQDWLTGCAFVSELDEATLRLFQAGRVRPGPGDGRRWVRFPCNVETVCYSPETAPGEEKPARILNISAGGLGLLLPCEFATGTLLQLDLAALTRPEAGLVPARPLLLRVLRCVGHANGDWFHGCEFADQLTDEELQALL